MKIEQIQYVLAIYETGSISKAAERFYLSRPNISNAVRNLESELGFEIMERGAKGVHFTKEGLLFAQKAVQILKEIDEIQEIGNSRSRLRFGIVNPNCPMVEEAFIRLCDRVERDDGLSNYQLSIYREYQYEGMRLLNQKKADLVITVSNNLNAPSMVREMEERGLEYRKLLDVPCNVNLSKDHPLAHDPDFKLEKLKDYPFVEYAIEGDRGSPYNRISQVSFINLSKLFRVSSGKHAYQGHRRHQRLQRGHRHASLLGGGIWPLLYPHSRIYHGVRLHPPGRGAGAAAGKAVYGIFAKRNGVSERNEMTEIKCRDGCKGIGYESLCSRPIILI